MMQAGDILLGEHACISWRFVHPGPVEQSVAQALSDHRIQNRNVLQNRVWPDPRPVLDV